MFDAKSDIGGNKIMTRKLMLKCPVCNSDLKLKQGYTGADWDCEAGDGSGYGHVISLYCTKDSCAHIFELGYVRDINDFSPVIDKYKSFK